MGFVGVAESLQRHGHGLPDPPARMAGEAMQLGLGGVVTLRQQAAEAERAAEGEELVASPAVIAEHDRWCVLGDRLRELDIPTGARQT